MKPDESGSHLKALMVEPYRGVSKAFRAIGVGRLRIDHTKLMCCSDWSHDQVDISECMGVGVGAFET